MTWKVYLAMYCMLAGLLLPPISYSSIKSKSRISQRQSQTSSSFTSWVIMNSTKSSTMVFVNYYSPIWPQGLGARYDYYLGWVISWRCFRPELKDGQISIAIVMNLCIWVLKFDSPCIVDNNLYQFEFQQYRGEIGIVSCCMGCWVCKCVSWFW